MITHTILTMKTKRFIFLFCLIFLSCLPFSYASTAPNIVVTLKPLHSLVSAITKGISKPQLLLNTTQSPHHTYLRPSDYRKVANADIVFWAAPSMEAFIPALEKKYADNTIFVSLMQADKVKRLPTRHQHHEHHSHETHSSSWDPHFWLSTYNAKQIIKTVTEQLISLDPENKKAYLNNQTLTLKKIEDLHAYLKTIFHSSQASFITYHDAYQYFEDEFQLTRLASVSMNEETSPGIKQVRAIKNLISSHQVQCIFYDAPVKPPILNTLTQGSNIRAVELDALGLRKPADANLWFDTIKTLGDNIANCLNASANSTH